MVKGSVRVRRAARFAVSPPQPRLEVDKLLVLSYFFGEGNWGTSSHRPATCVKWLK